MKRPCLILVLLLVWLVACDPAAAKVFFRVDSSAMPIAGKTGIQDLVLIWPSQDSSVIAQFRSHGYRVWLQCESKDLADAVGAAERLGAAGVIITNVASSGQTSAIEEVQSYAAAHKNLTFRLLIFGGKQPQMRGRLVVERDGVLQVSSPSTQPWLDTNLAVVRFAQAIYPNSLPAMYDFHWNTAGAPTGAWKPDAEDYALAIAEADAARSDVVVDFPTVLQKALAADDPQAWSMWEKVMPYLEFSSHEQTAKIQPVVGTGVIAEDAQSSYEPINLMARHNLAFEVIRPSGLTPARLGTWNSLIVFCSLNAEAAAMVRDFAAKGGIAIFVNSHDEFPWHSSTPAQRESHSTTYSIGSGQIVELGEPVIDPENFARDIRRLIGRERSTIALWNSLTTLVTGYRGQAHSETTLYLVNYADQPDNVQVQVKGKFARVRWESPEIPCCAALPSIVRNGFTEFTIPSLRIAGRVHLDSEAKGSTKK